MHCVQDLSLPSYLGTTDFTFSSSYISIHSLTLFRSRVYDLYLEQGALSVST